jgi:hypothetical protein
MFYNYLEFRTLVNVHKARDSEEYESYFLKHNP